MTGKPTIWLEHQQWDCGDGCCSDSWYKVETSDWSKDAETREHFYTKQDVVEFFNKYYPDYTLDWDKCSMAWYFNQESV